MGRPKQNKTKKRHISPLSFPGARFNGRARVRDAANHEKHPFVPPPFFLLVLCGFCFWVDLGRTQELESIDGPKETVLYLACCHYYMQTYDKVRASAREAALPSRLRGSPTHNG